MKKRLSALGAWALAFGCSIGWGAFVMPGTTYLPQSGVLGTIIGIAIGMGIMLLIARNYAILMAKHPDSGGAFSYTTHALGYDHGFLCAWFLCLTYIALIWAGVCALALLARYTFGDLFQFGFHYQIAGFDVYFGEVLFCLVIMVIGAVACLFQNRVGYLLEIFFALTLACGIVICFVGMAAGNPGSLTSIAPLFHPDAQPLAQVMRVVAIVPWIFVGFESISHSADEFAFSAKKSMRVMAMAIVASALAYVMLLLCGVMNIPDGYASWVEYIRDLDNLSGRDAMPVFIGIQRTMGKGGIILIGCTMFSALFTSVIGNFVSASRMLYALANDHVIPRWFGRLNRHDVPGNAILFILGISLFVPFLGRTAVSWHVDVSNVGASVAYGYTCLCVIHDARKSRDGKGLAAALLGLTFCELFLVLLLVPNGLTGTSLQQESYLILTGWVILGFAVYHRVFKRDEMGRFGKSTVVWIVLLFIGLFTAVSWQRQESLVMSNRVTVRLEEKYEDVLTEISTLGEEGIDTADQLTIPGSILDGEIDDMQQSYMRNSFVILAVVVLSVLLLIANYSILVKKNMEQEKTIGVVEKKASTDALTGVKNKTSYVEKEQALNQGIAGESPPAFALAVCDINDLKKVNDTLGHKAGDAYIQAGCLLICRVFQHSPVYRIGGDEFVAIVEHDDYENRRVLAARMEEAVQRSREEGEVVLAMGLADFNPETDECVQDVFERADHAMYEKKKQLKAKDGRIV